MGLVTAAVGGAVRVGGRAAMAEETRSTRDSHDTG